MSVTCARDRLEEMSLRIIGANPEDNRCLKAPIILRVGTLYLLNKAGSVHVTPILPFNVNLFES